MSLAVPYKQEAPATAGAIFELVRRGGARTRSDIARSTGLAPSTVSLRVEGLIEAGLLEETVAVDAGSAGRPPRVLRLNPRAMTVAAATLGARHFSLRIADQTGDELVTVHEPIDVSRGPDTVVDAIWTSLRRGLADLAVPESSLGGIALGIPAPVDPGSGLVTTSAQLPGWGNHDLYEIFRRRTTAPLILANDANLLAMAEYQYVDPTVRYLLAVKIGSRIGSGVIVDGRLLTGASGATGEISHSPTNAESVIRCFCGTENCLESVAGGSAVVERLKRQGYPVTSTADVVELAGTGDPTVLDVLRESGQLVGEVLASFVSFLNPDLVTFGGSLSTADAFVATVRGVIFQRCLPVVSAHLDVRVGRAGVNAEPAGGVQLVLDTVLAGDEIDRRLAGDRLVVPPDAAAG